MCANEVDLRQVAVENKEPLFCVPGLLTNLTSRRNEKRAAPEFNLSLHSDAIRCTDPNSICDRVGAHRRLPRGELPSAELFFLAFDPSDRGGEQ